MLIKKRRRIYSKDPDRSEQ